MKETGAHIEISQAKDQSLTFLVSGKQNDVLEARRKILVHFQTQVSLNGHFCYSHFFIFELFICFYWGTNMFALLFKRWPYQ